SCEKGNAPCAGLRLRSQFAFALPMEDNFFWLTNRRRRPMERSFSLPQARGLQGGRVESGDLRAVIYGGAFGTAAILTGFEISVSRYLNPYFGSGIYTWASLISTVLAALAVGYFAGGQVADRHPSGRVLGAAVLIGSAFILALPSFATVLLEA